MKRSSNDILKERRQVWRSKKILRKLYDKWYGIISEALRPGDTLELGGGSGNLKEFLSDVISSDILYVPWLDAVLDAHEIPFKDESLDSIVLFDVLHHLMSPALFFYEAERVLRPKGRIIMMEPYISWASSIIYRFFPHEGMDWHIMPFEMIFQEGKKEPFHGNQAIPTLIFEKYRKEFIRRFPKLEIIKEGKMDSILYPLSGGFHNPSLYPMGLYGFFKSLEKLLRPLNRCMAFRLFIVIEKKL